MVYVTRFVRSRLSVSCVLLYMLRNEFKTERAKKVTQRDGKFSSFCSHCSHWCVHVPGNHCDLILRVCINLTVRLVSWEVFKYRNFHVFKNDMHLSSNTPSVCGHFVSERDSAFRNSLSLILIHTPLLSFSLIKVKIYFRTKAFFYIRLLLFFSRCTHLFSSSSALPSQEKLTAPSSKDWDFTAVPNSSWILLNNF